MAGNLGFPDQIPVLPTVKDGGGGVAQNIRVTRGGNTRVTRAGNTRVTEGVTAGTDYPKARDINLGNRNIEQLAIELGAAPKTIDETVAPVITPQSVAQVLDMFANILKTITGAAHWYNAAVPSRHTIGGSFGGVTVPLSTTQYAGPWGQNLVALADEANVTVPMCYACRLTNFRLQTTGSQPGTGALTVTLRKNFGNTTATFDIAAGAGAGVGGVGSLSITFNPGDRLSISLNNKATAVSATLAGWSAEIDQIG